MGHNRAIGGTSLKRSGCLRCDGCTGLFPQRIDQERHKGRGKFGVALNAQHLVADDKDGVGTEGIAGQPLCARWQAHNLILVTEVELALGQRWRHPAGRGVDGKAVQAHAPPPCCLFGMTTQGMGQHLMTKTDAHQLLAGGITVAQKVGQRANPRLLVIDPLRAAGDKIGVTRGHGRRKVAFGDPVFDQGKLMGDLGKEALETTHLQHLKECFVRRRGGIQNS